MKTITQTFLFLLIAAPLTVGAQKATDNLDFENWGSNIVDGGPAPEGFPYAYGNSENTNDPYSGSSALKIESTHLQQGSADDTMGFAISSSFDGTTGEVFVKQAYSKRPDSVVGYIRTNDVNGYNDTAVVNFQLTKWNSTDDTAEFVGGAGTLIGEEIATWQRFSLPFQYANGETPDSLQVLFGSDGFLLGIGENPQGAVLEADGFEIVFDSTSSVLDQDAIQKEMSMYPNPSDGRFQVELPEAMSGTMEVRDMNGRIVRNKALDGDSQVTMNMDDVDDGIYMVHLKATNGETVAVEKLVLSR